MLIVGVAATLSQVARRDMLENLVIEFLCELLSGTNQASRSFYDLFLNLPGYSHAVLGASAGRSTVAFDWTADWFMSCTISVLSETLP